MNVSVEVARVGFTPLKGARHLTQPDAVFDLAGPVGDRRYCLIDPATHQVLKTVANPSLLSVEARLGNDGLSLRLPDGRSAAGQPELTGERAVGNFWGREVSLELCSGLHGRLLADFLDRDVTLARVPRSAVVYGEPISIVTTASLRALADRLDPEVGDLAALARRFRSTLVVNADEPFAEETWEGATIQAGALRLRIGAPIGRCAVIDLDPDTGARGTRILKTLASWRPRNVDGEPLFGVNASVVSVGARTGAGKTL